jgi:hypothetical protein
MRWDAIARQTSGQLEDDEPLVNGLLGPYRLFTQTHSHLQFCPCESHRHSATRSSQPIGTNGLKGRKPQPDAQASPGIIVKRPATKANIGANKINRFIAYRLWNHALMMAGYRGRASLAIGLLA